MRQLSVPVVEAAEYVPDAKDEWITALGQCESHASSTIKVLDVNSQYSYGTLQFQMSTWLRYSKQFGTTPENIYDPNLQKTVARYMLDSGGQRSWFNCANKIGPYPLYGKKPS